MSALCGVEEAAATRLGNRREARWIVEAAARSQEKAFSEQAVQVMVERRCAGEPLQYVLGSWSFRRLELTVDRRVLIPRPETEQVVSAALDELDRTKSKRRTVVDLGTGSGAIALSIATERPGVEVWATDMSEDAVAVGRANDREGVVRFVDGDWWAALPGDLRGNVDVVVSNPPYVSRSEMPGLDPQVRDWEPRIALEAGERGTEAIEVIIDGGLVWLKSGGSIVIELAPHQARPMAQRARSAGFAHAETKMDLARLERILIVRKQ